MTFRQYRPRQADGYGCGEHGLPVGFLEKKRPQGAQPHNDIVRSEGPGETSPASRMARFAHGKSHRFCSSL